jgi:hypothetical protein
VLKSPYIEYAINNLRVRRNTEPRMEREPQAASQDQAPEAKKPVESAHELQNHELQNVEVKPAVGLN